MLSNLASYLMGSAPSVPLGASTASTSAAAASTEVAQGTVIAQQELHCIEEEDWLLVHPEDNRQTTESSCFTGKPDATRLNASAKEPSLSLDSQEGSGPITIQQKQRRDCCDEESEESEDVCRMECGRETKNRNDTENCAPSAGLEESWYVAPSACIARRRPVKLATSPLENLLIEHPSMSVYHHSLTDELPSTSLSPVTIEDDQEDEATPNEEMIQIVDYMKQRFRRMRKSATSYNNSNNKEKQLKYQSSSNSRKQELAVPTAATPTVPHLKSQKVALEAAMLGGRVSQKKDRTNRSQLDRLNKCSASSNQKRLRRSDRQHSNRNSFVNNNRRSSSQRTC